LLLALAKLLIILKMEDSTYKWHVIYTKSQHEKKVLTDSKSLCVDSYLPLIKSVRYWSDRKKIIDLPLFPNYIFLKLATSKVLKVLDHPSIIGFVKVGNEFVTLPDEQIQSIRLIESKEMDYFVKKNCFTKGKVIQVKCGPLKGLIGEVVNCDKKTYFTIVLKHINNAIFVRLDRNCLVCC
jgi:transcriptional antiterminator RfaH